MSRVEARQKLILLILVFQRLMNYSKCGSSLELSMSLSTFLNPVIIALARNLVLFVILVLGALIVFISQASSLDYQALFWRLFPFALIHLLLVSVYYLCVRSWHRWFALLIGVIAIIGWGEMALRVFP
jgi:hypothetical protein